MTVAALKLIKLLRPHARNDKHPVAQAASTVLTIIVRTHQVISVATQGRAIR